MTQKTTIDWLRFRVRSEPRDVLQALKTMFPDHSEWVHFNYLAHGIMGFQQGAQILVADMVVGRMDYGGESQRGWVRVDITGKGCEWMNFDNVSCLENLPMAEIRRLDIALTTWNGEVTHAQVVKAHEEGRFMTRGRPPDLTQITSSNERAGRTCYVGQRERSDKFARCYEKGFEMLAKTGRLPGICTHIDGHKVEDIYRCELELKASNTPIPWEVIERRDQYFVGAYPFFADVLPGIESDILQRRPERSIQADLAVSLENCCIQFGPTIFTALMAYHGDMTTVFDKIIGKHHSQALIEAGVLLVEHE